MSNAISKSNKIIIRSPNSRKVTFLWNFILSISNWFRSSACSNLDYNPSLKN